MGLKKQRNVLYLVNPCKAFPAVAFDLACSLIVHTGLSVRTPQGQLSLLFKYVAA
jgi:ABC-type tungstate transport system substrate-binding protein